MSKMREFAIVKSSAKIDALVELLIFAAIVLAPAILSSFGPELSLEAKHEALYSQTGFLKALASSLRFGLVAAFFLYIRGREASWGDVSTKQTRWQMQVLAGVGLWFAYYLFFDFWSVIAAFASIRTPSIAWLHPAESSEIGLNAAFSLVNGISEEVMRVYLLGQTQRTGVGRAGATLVVAVAMASYHFYQGAFTVIAFILAHIVLNRFYLARRSLLTLIVWHILADFTHSTDLAGWQFVSEMINGSLGMAIVALARLFGKSL